MSAGTRTEADEASTNTTFRSAGARQDKRVGVRSQDTQTPTPTLTPLPNQQRARRLSANPLFEVGAS